MRRKLYFSFDSASPAASSRRMIGRRKIIRLRLVRPDWRDLNSPPSSGIRDSPGMPWTDSLTSSDDNPPSTSRVPSATCTVVLISRLLVIRSTAPADCVGDSDDTSCTISMRTLSPSLTCGVTLRIRPTSLRSMVWNGVAMLPVLPVPPVAA